jgi:hypothetical protein
VRSARSDASSCSITSVGVQWSLRTATGDQQLLLRPDAQLARGDALRLPGGAGRCDRCRDLADDRRVRRSSTSTIRIPGCTWVHVPSGFVGVRTGTTGPVEFRSPHEFEPSERLPT